MLAYIRRISGVTSCSSYARVRAIALPMLDWTFAAATQLQGNRKKSLGSEAWLKLATCHSSKRTRQFSRLLSRRARSIPRGKNFQECRLIQQPEQVQVQAVATEPRIAPSTGMVQWSLATRLAFRLVFAYKIIYSFPFPLDLVHGFDKAFGWHQALFAKITVFTGAHILHLNQPLAYSPNAGGDSLFGCVQNLAQLMIAVAAAVIWTLLDRKRPNYRSMQEWLWLYVRLVLGTAMMSYGAVKVIKDQFPDLFLWRLLSSYGESSPGGLLWSFMGYSRTYNLFTGLVELIGGALLFVPRLATLGALLSVGAMANVFMLNLSYDVPVKLYSFNLLLMGLYLMAPEGRRMLDFFVLNRPVVPVT